MSEPNHPPIPTRTEEVARAVIQAAIKVHTVLGPGLLESAYQACLCQELGLRGLSVRAEVTVPVVYEGMKLNAGFRIDLLVEECVVLEIKSCDGIHPIHVAQVLTYLKLSGRRLGFVLNFNVLAMKEGIKRVIL